MYLTKQSSCHLLQKSKRASSRTWPGFWDNAANAANCSVMLVADLYSCSASSMKSGSFNEARYATRNIRKLELGDVLSIVIPQLERNKFAKEKHTKACIFQCTASHTIMVKCVSLRTPVAFHLTKSLNEKLIHGRTRITQTNTTSIPNNMSSRFVLSLNCFKFDQVYREDCQY